MMGQTHCGCSEASSLWTQWGKLTVGAVGQVHCGCSGEAHCGCSGKLTVGAVGQVHCGCSGEAHCGCSGKLTVDDAILRQVGLGCVRIVAEQASKELSSTILPQFLPLGFYLGSRLASVIHYYL